LAWFAASLIVTLAIGDRHLATRFAVGGCLERLRTNRRLRLPLLLRSKFIGVVLDRMPNWWLIAIQAYRVLGVTFLIGWARATVFALPAGIGDVSVGLVAIPIAYLLATGWRSAPKFAIAWNLLGLLDFTIVIGIGILTTLQIIVPDRPIVALGVFPAVMIPAFAVPSWTLLHALSLPVAPQAEDQSSMTELASFGALSTLWHPLGNGPAPGIHSKTRFEVVLTR